MPMHADAVPHFDHDSHRVPLFICVSVNVEMFSRFHDPRILFMIYNLSYFVLCILCIYEINGRISSASNIMKAFETLLMEVLFKEAPAALFIEALEINVTQLHGQTSVNLKLVSK